MFFSFTVRGEFLQIPLCQKRAHFIPGRTKMVPCLPRDPGEGLSSQLTSHKTFQGRRNSKDGPLRFLTPRYPNTNLGAALKRFCRCKVQGQVTLKRGDYLGGSDPVRWNLKAESFLWLVAEMLEGSEGRDTLLLLWRQMGPCGEECEWLPGAGSGPALHPAWTLDLQPQKSRSCHTWMSSEADSPADCSPAGRPLRFHPWDLSREPSWARSDFWPAVCLMILYVGAVATKFVLTRYVAVEINTPLLLGWGL